jgi:hypothetical protein
LERRVLLILAGMLLLIGCAVAVKEVWPATAPATTRSAVQWKLLALVPAAEATQAAAADERFFYAVSSTTIAKYDRLTFQCVATSTPKVHHLNSAYLHAGRIYCAHSNYPEMPESSQLMMLDVATMKLSVAHDFGNYGGSLTWAIRYNGRWWANFARYQQKVGETFLAEFDNNWKEIRRFTYPPQLLSQLGGKYSLSGGLFRGDLLMVTGHNDPIVFRLRLPKKGNVLEMVDAQEVPFHGQGFAIDPVTRGMIGVIRKDLRLVLAGEPDHEQQ